MLSKRWRWGENASTRMFITNTRALKKTSLPHQEFLAFKSYHERIDSLHTSIRDKRIHGALTDSYHQIKV